MNAIYVYIAFQVVTIPVWGIFEIAGHRQMNVLNLSPEIATMGTILVLLVYLPANLALPVYFKRHRPSEFKVVRHAMLPMSGALTVIVPISSGSHFSGDIFSVSRPLIIMNSIVRFRTAPPRRSPSDTCLPWDYMDPFYEAVVQSVEEAVLNALCANEDMTGRALPHD